MPCDGDGLCHKVLQGGEADGAIVDELLVAFLCEFVEEVGRDDEHLYLRVGILLNGGRDVEGEVPAKHDNLLPIAAEQTCLGLHSLADSGGCSEAVGRVGHHECARTFYVSEAAVICLFGGEGQSTIQSQNHLAEVAHVLVAFVVPEGFLLIVADALIEERLNLLVDKAFAHHQRSRFSDVAGNPSPAQTLRHCSRRAAASEEVANEVAFIG